jgi:beta-glucosidase-like glycosyl hydrolase
MNDLAQLLVPALRWSAANGFEGERDLIELALRMQVGGFILFGGAEEDVRALTRELRRRSRIPLLLGADLERGAGQQFGGATGLPPLAAIAWLEDEEAVRRAARLTAREARTLGLNWDYAPVCDLDIVPENPIVGTRAFGSDPRRVAALAKEWIGACQAEGVLACAKHFPGHGRTRTDSHVELPVVDAPRKALMQTDIVPFRAAIDAGVASVMTAHVAYPELDASGAPASLSRDIIQWLLRQQLRFDGLVVTDAMIMEAFRGDRGEGEAAVQAIGAGCDLLLYPEDLEAVAAALEEARGDFLLDVELVRQAQRRRLKWAQWASPPNEYRRPAPTDVTWGAQLAERVVHTVRGEMPAVNGQLSLIVVDDDVGGPYPPPSREAFTRALHAAGVEAVQIAPGTVGPGPLIVALFGDVRGWKGYVGYSGRARQEVARAVEGRQATIVQFGHPRFADQLPVDAAVLSAWGGDPCMQEAAARVLARTGR